jgi:hypothetical protein
VFLTGAIFFFPEGMGGLSDCGQASLKIADSLLAFEELLHFLLWRLQGH